MCEAGEDTDYYKKPVFLTPVKQGPFYALKAGPALLAVCGGLKCNNDFQCLDENGEVIEGLYVLGNIMGDITAVDHPSQRRRQRPRPLHYSLRSPLLGHELPPRPKSPARETAYPLRPFKKSTFSCGCEDQVNVYEISSGSSFNLE